MRKIATSIIMIALAFSLNACNDVSVKDIQVGTREACKYVPTASLVVKIVTGITGLPPGVGIGIDVSEKVITSICAAVKEQTTTGARAGVFVRAQNEVTGEVQYFALEGKKVPSKRK